MQLIRYHEFCLLLFFQSTLLIQLQFLIECHLTSDESSRHHSIVFLLIDGFVHLRTDAHTLRDVELRTHLH
jgi:hypothetical protein